MQSNTQEWSLTRESLPSKDRSNDSPAQSLLNELLRSSIVLVEDWEQLPPTSLREIEQCSDAEDLLSLLLKNKLVTDYQAARISAGKTFGLMLGNYRVLDRLGAGGMGVVFRGEHKELRRNVAIKVLTESSADVSTAQRRFMVEMRAIAELRHPNIVGAIDSGHVISRDPQNPNLRYFVMEHVPGQDLEQYVIEQGPLAVEEACDLVRQIASALLEAQRCNLVHRDIKPSNIRRTPSGTAKLLDFGLARPKDHRVTEPGTLLGTLDYVAPEQARDAASVDIRADIYSLGATLYWCLAQKPPFKYHENPVQQLAARLTEPPPSIREIRPDVAKELDSVIRRMMAADVDDRYPTPQAVIDALDRFVQPELPEHLLQPTKSRKTQLEGELERILIVDDYADVRDFCQMALMSNDRQCDVAGTAAETLDMLKNPYDLIVLDVDLPGMTGAELCEHLRNTPPCPNLKIIMCSGRADGDELARILMAGADDYLTKPISLTQLQGRVAAALRLKKAQDRADALNRHLQAVNQELERSLGDRDHELIKSRNSLVLALSRLVGSRSDENSKHELRMPRYCRALAEEAASLTAFEGQIDENFIDLLECCAPLHDIGKVGLPDHILLKPGKLEPDERMLMQTHTVIGCDTLREIAREQGFSLAFLDMAADIARHHHERFDGEGYPDGLAGDEIPLAARIVAIADVYDALRTRRSYKPALSHQATVKLMTGLSKGQFDAALMEAFDRAVVTFERIFQDYCDD